jgi:glucosamine 6-phosphate synthetase-like amidotransferase/phosphosugar isomerase protein
MCGLAGIVFCQGAAPPAGAMALFSCLLALSEPRGPHAAGAAWLGGNGRSRLLKRPGAPSAFLASREYSRFAGSVPGDAAAVIGHARWRTRGSEADPANNHPIRAGAVIGSHNGTVLNADRLFMHWGYKREGEVDSEILVRLAADCLEGGSICVPRLAKGLRLARGSMSAVFLCRSDPSRIFAIKGDKPLVFRWNSRQGILAYASSAHIIDAALDDAPDWAVVYVPAMSIAVFDRRALSRPTIFPFSFIREAAHAAS